MSRTVNKVELLGRVGAQPEMRYTPGGTAVTRISLATDRRKQDGTPKRIGMTWSAGEGKGRP